MFSGIGGFEYGIQRACDKQSTEIEQDWQRGDRTADKMEHDVLPTSRTAPLCIGFSELDKYATSIYKQHYKEHEGYGDCTKINWSEVENFDCLVGGFPCQAFSIAGKRAGFDDTRGTLFFEIARALREKQPRLCVLENVKGLLSHDKGNTFFTILTTLDELGYDCEWQVFNSKNFGVPQNRERIFIIGHLRGAGGRKIFPIGRSNTKALKQIIGGGQGNRVYDIDGVSCTQASQAGGQGAKTGLYNMGSKIRRLTPTECERLQGFPDGWTEGLSDTQRYKCLGNAVTTNVITAIFTEINKLFPQSA